MTYTLIVFLFAGMMSDSDSVAVTTIDNFKSQASCEAAGQAAIPVLVRNTKKDGRFVCVKTDVTRS